MSNSTPASFEVTLYGVNNLLPYKFANWVASGIWPSTSAVFFSGGGEVSTQSARVDGVEVSLSVREYRIAYPFYLYGIKNQ